MAGGAPGGLETGAGDWGRGWGLGRVVCYFLEQDCGQTLVALELGELEEVWVALFSGEDCGQDLGEFLADLHDNVVGGLAFSSLGDSGLDGQDGFNDFEGLLVLEGDVGVFVHSEHVRVIEVRELVDVRLDRFERVEARHGVHAVFRYFVSVLQKLGAVVLLQDAQQARAVPVRWRAVEAAG